MESTNPEPPPEWMLPGFDPNSVKVAELRSILLENNIPHSYTKKSNLVELFERQVRPMAPKLLQAHLSVKPSAAGIFDMRTGRYLTESDSGAPREARTPRKTPSSSINLIDQESLTSTSSRRTTRQSSQLNSKDNDQTASEADLQLTPQPKSARDRTDSSRSEARKSTRISTPNPPRRIPKRKASEQTLSTDPVFDSQLDQLALPAEMEENSNSSDDLPSSSITRAKASVSPAPVKKRRSELQSQSKSTTDNPDVADDQLAITKKKITQPKNRRSTLHETIEAGDANFSDFNPFQSGLDEEKIKISPSKSRSPTRQSSLKRPSIASTQLPKSSTTPNIFTPNFPVHSNPVSQHAPKLPSVPPTPYTSSILPKSITASNVHSLQTPARQSARQSGPFPSLPSHKQLAMPHLQDDYDSNNSFEQDTPEQIHQLLAPGRHNLNIPIRVEDERSRDHDASHEQLSTEELRSASDSNDFSPPVRRGTTPCVSSINSPVQSRRQSQLPPRTPYAHTLHHSSNSQRPTSLSRPQVQRIRLEELVHQTPAEKRLKINRPKKSMTARSSGSLLFNPGQGISFLLRLCCLGLMLGMINWYLKQAEKLGYCDTGKMSNAITRDQRIDQFLELGDGLSDAQFDTFSGTFKAKIGQVLEACSMIGLLPDCQNCPTHAICERGKIVRCETDYVQTHTDWERMIHRWVPMIMGPKCAPDTVKLIKIVEVANQINQILRRRRGQVLCDMGMKATDEEEEKSTKVQIYGLQEDEIKEMIRSSGDYKSLTSTPMASTTSTSEDEIIELAIQDLERSEEIIRTKDGWLTTRDFKSIDIGFGCRLKLGLFKLIKKFKLFIISLTIVTLTWFYLRIKLSKISLEKEKVRELVELALNKLRDESWIHHTNPSLSPNPPTLASAQLRDLILSYDHSALNRQKLWKKVEKIVEGNSNVRTKVSEIRGESIKVWEWIGSYKGSFNLNQSHHHHPSSGHQPPHHQVQNPSSHDTTLQSTINTTNAFSPVG